VASVDTISGARDTLDVTAIKQPANARLLGLKNGAWSFTTFFEPNPASISTPGVPGSGTPVTNTNSVTVWVTVTGGTGTNVTINGVAQGSFDGTYAVPSGGTISLTYSVAPTWNWFQLGSEHSALIRFPTTDQIATYFRGTSMGGVAAAINSKQTDYDFTRDNTGNLTAKVDLAGNSFGMEWGEQLTVGIRTDTSATAGPVQDDGASSAFGAQAYLQLIALVGTNIDVAIQHATTSGGSYSNIIDFGSIATASVPTAVRAAVANTTTINEFLKVTTTGTFSFAQFAVVFCRNPIAGIVF